MPIGPNSESPNSESGMADGRWRVPHDDWTLGANHVSRAPESGWPIPLPVISGLATGPPAGVGDGLRFLSRRANTSCPSSDRFRLRELRESQHFTGHLFRHWIPSPACGKGGGPRRFTAIVLNVSRRRFGGPARVEPQSPGEPGPRRGGPLIAI